jgi:integrase
MSQLVAKKERRRSRVYWIVSLGKRYTGAVRHRRYFRSRKEANAFIRQSEMARQQLGLEAFILSRHLRAEAFLCLERLKPFNETLTQAVDFFLCNRRSLEREKSIEELRDEFLKSRTAMNCRPRTLIQYESYLRVICDGFPKADIRRILREDIEDWLEESGWSPRTRKNYLVTLTTLLNYAAARGYRTDNPAAGIARPILDDCAVGILTVDQAKRLLQVTRAAEPRLIPAVVVGLFAGLRRSEYFVLDWEEIDLENRTIEIKAIKAKTRQRRLAQISDNLREWLLPQRKCGGRVTPERNIDVFSERLRGLAQKAGIDPWPQNAIRHSFGSYFLGQTKDENLTATQMGNAPGIVVRHYRAVVRDADVAEYWRISPTTLPIG